MAKIYVKHVISYLTPKLLESKLTSETGHKCPKNQNTSKANGATLQLCCHFSASL